MLLSKSGRKTVATLNWGGANLVGDGGTTLPEMEVTPPSYLMGSRSAKEKRLVAGNRMPKSQLRRTTTDSIPKNKKDKVTQDGRAG